MSAHPALKRTKSVLPGKAVETETETAVLIPDKTAIGTATVAVPTVDTTKAKVTKAKTLRRVFPIAAHLRKVLTSITENKITFKPAGGKQCSVSTQYLQGMSANRDTIGKWVRSWNNVLVNNNTVSGIIGSTPTALLSIKPYVLIAPKGQSAADAHPCLVALTEFQEVMEHVSEIADEVVDDQVSSESEGESEE